MMVQPCCSLDFPLTQESGWQGVCEAECHEIDDPCLFPMGKRFSELFVGVWGLKNLKSIR
jgi:hypothetical protein